MAKGCLYFVRISRLVVELGVAFIMVESKINLYSAVIYLHEWRSRNAKKTYHDILAYDVH